MNSRRPLILLALTPLALFAGCQQAPLMPQSDPRLESRLAKMEAQLYRLEETLVKLAEAKEASEAKQAEKAQKEQEAPAAEAHARISVYVYGESLPRPGEQVIRSGGTVLMAVASAGGVGPYGSKKLTVVRKEKDDIELDGVEEWKNFSLEDGDVIMVKASVF